LLGAVVVVQTLLAMAPGDAIDALPNPEEARAVLEAEWQLDQPLPVQVAAYVADAVRGDLRTSLAYKPGKPVSEILAAPARTSATLAISATIVSLVGGTRLALAGGRWGSRRLVQVVSIVPVFLLAHVTVEALNGTTWALIQHGTIARPGWFALPVEPHPFRQTLAIVVLAVGSGALAEVADEVTHTLSRIMRSGYIDAARARGERLWPHIAINLIGPLTTVVATRVAFFIGGLVIIEKVLLIEGLGKILWAAAQLRDYPLALGITLIAATAVGLVRFGGDVLRTVIDPRLRGGSS
jgi:ABC-type dipeptide/oligopeptide/nickel transport system permease component